MRRLSWSLVLALLSAVMLPAVGQAASLARPRLVGSGEAISERVTIECKEKPDTDVLRCSARARWTIQPGVDAPRQAIFYTDAVEVRWASVDGEAIAVTTHHDPREGLQRVVLDLPPRSSAFELELSLVVEPHPRFLGCGFTQSLAAVRHPFWRRSSESAAISMGAFGSMQEDDPEPVAEPEDSQITIIYPEPWQPSDRRRWASTRVGTDRASLRSGVGDGVWLHIPERHHGPLVAGGGQFHGRRARPWLRAGYEASWVRFMTHAVTAETDLRRWTLVAATEFGTPNLGMLIPAASVGVGLPVRVHPQPRPGARIQAALSWPLVGVVGTFDAFPRMLPWQRTEYVGGVALQMSI